MRLPFTKMHGLGNDFMVVDRIGNDVELDAVQIRRLADRHFGIGFDQLLLIEAPMDSGVDFNYRIFNADGREVEHCGNGARCFAVYVTEKGLTGRNPLRVRTLNRILSLYVHTTGEVTVDMGAPEFAPARIPFRAEGRATTYRRKLMVAGEPREIVFSALSMGNPHAVIIVEHLARAAVKEIGEALARHADFPNGVNVSFMSIIDSSEINLRVWERGAGETLACGSGACAAAVAGQQLGLLTHEVTANLSGGRLAVTWRGGDAPVLMTGPATRVYDGVIEL